MPAPPLQVPSPVFRMWRASQEYPVPFKKVEEVTCVAANWTGLVFIMVLINLYIKLFMLYIQELVSCRLVHLPLLYVILIMLSAIIYLSL